jgi:hypothetical protein
MKVRIGIGVWLFSVVSVVQTASASDLVLPVAGAVEIELVGSEAAWANTLSATLVCPCNTGGGCQASCACDIDCSAAAAPAAFSGTGLTVPTIGTTPAYPNSGCNMQPAITVNPVFLLSEKKAGLLAVPPDLTPTQRGCRVKLKFLDRNNMPQDIFPAGSQIRFEMCSKTDATAACNHTWYSEPSLNTETCIQNTPGVCTNDGTGATRQFTRFSWAASDPCVYPPGGQPGCQQAAGEHVRTVPVLANKVWRMEWEDLPWGTDGAWADMDDLIVNVRVTTDTDGDGLYDDWETAGGIDIDNNGTLDVTLPGAHVNAKDVYVHFDYLSCQATNTSPTLGSTTYDYPNAWCKPCVTNSDCDHDGQVGNGTCNVSGVCNHSHQPDANALAAIETAFLNAPGGPFYFHYEIGNALPHTKWMTIRFTDASAAGCGDLTAFCPDPNVPCTVCNDANVNAPTNCIRSYDEYKKLYFGNNNPKRYAYHYAIIGHRLTSGSQNTGCGEEPGNDFLVTIGGPTDVNIGGAQELAGTIMHELGHNFFLAHGGDPYDVNERTNKYKPNYPSVMSYTFQTSGIPGLNGTNNGTNGLNYKIDYSAGTLPNLSEASLSEVSLAYTGQTKWIRNSITFTSFENFNTVHDWDGVSAGAGPYVFNIDDDTNGGAGWQNSVHKDYNDWMYAYWAFQTVVNFEDGVHEPGPSGGEASYAEAHPPFSDAGAIPDGNPNSAGDFYTCDLGTSAGLDGTGSYDTAEGVIEDYQWSFNTAEEFGPNGALAAYSCTTRLGAAPIFLTVTDNDGYSTIDRTTANVTLNGGANQVLECDSPAGRTFTVGTNPLLPASGFSYVWKDGATTIGTTAQVTHTFGFGGHAVSVMATDTAAPIGDVSQSDALSITVQDTTPPTISSVSPNDPELSILWPGNHKMNTINFSVSVTDVCDSQPVCSITSITSNEPIEGLGDGDTSPDWQILAASGPTSLNANLRAERGASGTGRVYTIAVQCVDDFNNASSANAYVSVPLNQN